MPALFATCFDMYSSWLPGLKLEQPIFTTPLPAPGHERVNKTDVNYF